jgi:hypothetical protein
MLVEALAGLPRPRQMGVAADAVRAALTQVNRLLVDESRHFDISGGADDDDPGDELDPPSEVDD